MNFEILKARVQKQAAVAADAARSIRNFDQMAANDDYIHHDDLRTPDAHPAESPQQRQVRVREEVTRINNRQQQQLPPIRRTKSPPRSASVRSTAAQALSQATQFSTMLSYSDEDDDDEQIIVDDEQPKKKKNPNRFMDDLDDRLAAPQEEVTTNERNMQKLEIEPPRLQQQLSGWLKSPVVANVLSKLQSPTAFSNTANKEETKPMLTVGPLSRRAAQDDDSDDDEEDPMEHHTIVSSSVMGASEQAELERIRGMANSGGLLTSMMTTLKKNKEFAFILFTLVLGTAAYFYSRHREEIDDVT